MGKSHLTLEKTKELLKTPNVQNEPSNEHEQKDDDNTA